MIAATVGIVIAAIIIVTAIILILVAIMIVILRRRRRSMSDRNTSLEMHRLNVQDITLPPK